MSVSDKCPVTIITMMGDILNQLITDNALCIFNDGSHTLFDSTRSEALDITFGNAHSLNIKIHSLSAISHIHSSLH